MTTKSITLTHSPEHYIPLFPFYVCLNIGQTSQAQQSETHFFSNLSHHMTPPDIHLLNLESQDLCSIL